MTRDESLEVVAMLLNGWPGKEWSAAEMDSYAHAIETWDARFTTRAVVMAQKELEWRPSVAKLREFVRIEQKLSEPDKFHEPAPMRRELPDWLKGKLVALAAGDVRAWPEQKEGYDAIQLDNPFFESYVWPRQQQVSEEERRFYVEQGRELSAEKLHRIMQATLAVS